MAFWDGNKIIKTRPKRYKDYPGWFLIDCGCCSGIEWGGEYPRECRDCGGTGAFAWHKKSGCLAEYPGGKFLGKTS